MALKARREGDAVISISHDLEQNSVTITGVNDTAQSLLGYKREEFIDSNFLNLVTGDAYYAIEEYLTGDNNIYGLEVILGRIHHFSLLHKFGNSIKVSVKGYHNVSDHKSHNYDLLIRDVSIYERLDEFRNLLLGSMTYSMDNSLGIWDSNSMGAELVVITKFVEHYNMDVVIATMSLDVSVSNSDRVAALKEVIKAFKLNTRQEDVIGMWDDSTLLFMLVDCKDKNATLAVQRVHSAIVKELSKFQGSLGYNFTVSIGYINSVHNVANDLLVSRAQDALVRAHSKGGNSIMKATL